MKAQIAALLAGASILAAVSPALAATPQDSAPGNTIAAHAMHADTPSHPKNVNFRGTWISGSGDWTVKSENAKTGACIGTTAFVGYSFSGCKVTGSAYRFVVAQNGTSYRSINTGTISGNTVHGKFNDGRGGTAYIAHRK